MDDRAFIRDLEGFHDRRFLAFVVLGVLVFAFILAVVVAGFRQNHVYASADAVALAQAPPSQVSPAPPAGSVRVAPRDVHGNAPLAHKLPVRSARGHLARGHANVKAHAATEFAR
jgi:hypothetical protein